MGALTSDGVDIRWKYLWFILRFSTKFSSFVYTNEILNKHKLPTNECAIENTLTDELESSATQNNNNH